MMDKDHKWSWGHLVVKLIIALIIFCLGVFVGEFKIMKKLVLADHGGAGWTTMMGSGLHYGMDPEDCQMHAGYMMGGQGKVLIKNGDANADGPGETMRDQMLEMMGSGDAN